MESAPSAGPPSSKRLLLAARWVAVGAPEHRHGEEPHRDVHPEHRAPPEVLGEEPAHHRADDRGQAPGAGEDALDGRALLQRVEVGADGERGGLHRARRPRPWSTRKRDQHRDAGGEAAEHRAEEEQAHPGDEGRPAAEPVREAAPEEHAEGARQQKPGEHPGVERAPVQLGGERGHRGGDHRGLEGRHHQPEEDRRGRAPPLGAGGRRLPGDEGARGLHARLDLISKFPCRRRMTRILSLRRARAVPGVTLERT